MSGCRTAPLPKGNVFNGFAGRNKSGRRIHATGGAARIFEPRRSKNHCRQSNESVKSDGNSQAELSLPELIIQVQNRNPSLQAMAASWQAAAQRYPQVVSLDDPTFSAMAAPASFGSNDVESAYAFQAGQKFPWFGKRRRPRSNGPGGNRRRFRRSGGQSHSVE